MRWHPGDAWSGYFPQEILGHRQDQLTLRQQRRGISSSGFTPDLLDFKCMQDSHDLLFITDSFTDLNHLSEVFHQTTIRPFRSLTRAYSTPLGRVQITSLEMGLGT